MGRCARQNFIPAMPTTATESVKMLLQLEEFFSANNTMPHAYTEDQLVEQPAIGLFAELGWTTVSAMEETFGATGTLLRETKGEVVLVAAIHQEECTLPNSLRRAAAGGVARATFAENVRKSLISRWLSSKIPLLAAVARLRRA